MNIRSLKLSDAENLLAYFSELVRLDPERVERPEDVAKLTIENEVSWVKKCLENEKKNDLYALCCEIDGKIVAVGEIERKPRWIEKHVAEIRFGVIPGHESAALELVKKLEEIAKSNGIEVLFYFHLATQKNGIKIVQKAGFTSVGIIKKYYKRGQEYVDRVYLQKAV